MKIATWNVNSIRSRLERLLAWLQKAQPDVVCLQELKATDEAFPYEPIQRRATMRRSSARRPITAWRSSAGRAHGVAAGFGRRRDDSQARFLRPRLAASTSSAPTCPTARSSARRRMLTSSSGSGGCGHSWTSSSRPRRRWSSAATSMWPATRRTWPIRRVGQQRLVPSTSRTALEELLRLGSGGRLPPAASRGRAVFVVGLSDAGVPEERRPAAGLHPGHRAAGCTAQAPRSTGRSERERSLRTTPR